ncbi:MAG: restriction endonuclease subunit S [Actinobacteria bacterium]|nr:restriction endonuclease subunit S [Actinomycetota bacterium]
MGGEWRIVRIGDLGRVVTGRTPPGNDPAYYGGDVPFLTPSDLADQRRVEHPARTLSAHGAVQLARCLVPEGVGVSCIGWQMGKAVLIDRPTITNQQINSIVVEPKIADARFVYYSLRNRRDELFGLGAGGSRTPILNKGDFERLRFVLPPLVEQRAIAHILGTLDDKIELNRRTNETLEAMARSLFKSWFVDFDPVRAKAEGRDPGLPQPLADLFPESFEDSKLGEIPRGWDAATLSDLATLNPESWSRETRPEVIEYVDLSNTKWGRIDAVTSYSTVDAPSRAQRVLRPPDTIVGTVRPGNGSYALISADGLTGSTGFAVLRPDKCQYAEFVYLAASAPENIERLAHLADGAAYPAVRPEVVAATQVVKSDAKVMQSFSGVASSMLSKVAANEAETGTLSALRDTLLPKLISGEVLVKDAERFIGRPV